MKKFLLFALPFVMVSTLALKPLMGELPIGADLPKADLKMKDITSKEVSFKDAKKKNGLLVMFSCNTCPVVKGYQSRYKEILKYTLEKNIGVILLNPNEASRNDGDSYNDMKEFAKDNGYDWYYVVDKNSEMANVFGANRTPECFLFSKDDKLVYHGAIDDNARNAESVGRYHLKEAINEMTGGKDISVKVTRSVGCSIKRL